MKLYNKTKCPDEILKPLLLAAGKSIGSRMAKVVVKVTQGRTLKASGKVIGMPLVYSWHLRIIKSRRKLKNNNLGRLIQTDGGWIELVLPKLYSVKRMKCWPTIDALSLARSFYKTAQHEWAHIKDNQLRISKPTPRTPSGRRIEWCYRPCEQYAQKQVKQAKQMEIDDLLLELACWIEQNRKTK